MQRFLLSIFALAIIVFGVKAQTNAEAPIRWQITVKMLSATEGTATFKARLQPGWHLYGLQMPKNGPKATVINTDESTGIEWVTPLTPDREPLTVHDAMFGVDLQWWDTDIALRRRFKVTDKAAARVAGKITYMGCNDQTCLPPATQEFNKKVQVK